MTTTTGTSGSTGTPDPPGPAAGPADRPAARPGTTARVPGRGSSPRSRVLVAGVGLAACALVVGLSVADADDDPASARALPDTLAGLPAQRSGPSDEIADQLTRRLASEPSVADVAVRAYGDGAEVLVVLDLTPRSALTDQAAGELTARVLGAAGPQRGMSDDFRSAVSDDGLALLTCSTSQPGASTCVSVEADRALVVLTTGADEDPLTLAAAVRDEVDGRG